MMYTCLLLISDRTRKLEVRSMATLNTAFLPSSGWNRIVWRHDHVSQDHSFSSELKFAPKEETSL